jgi:hypothetical protein
VGQFNALFLFSMKWKLLVPLTFFSLIVVSCQKDETSTTITNTGNSGVLPNFSYKVNGKMYESDSFHAVLKNCTSCSYRKIYIYAYRNGINNFIIEFLPSLGTHTLSHTDAVMQFLPTGGSWRKSSNNGSLQINELDSTNNIIAGQFAFVDSTFTISSGSFYLNRMDR